MYEIVRGPLVWIAFVGFFAGLVYRVVVTARLARREKVVLPTFDLGYGLRSIAHWLVPFASRSTRMNPLFTVVSYAFHVCLLVTPLFALGHAVLWQQSWGVRWWSLPERVTDVMTLVVIFGALFFAIRRLTRPEVRNVTTWSDFGLLAVVVAPFVTGFAAHHQWFSSEWTLIAHIVAGALWLLLIPWTRLVHMIWFAVSRAYMGAEFGSVRHARDW